MFIQHIVIKPLNNIYFFISLYTLYECYKKTYNDQYKFSLFKKISINIKIDIFILIKQYCYLSLILSFVKKSDTKTILKNHNIVIVTAFKRKLDLTKLIETNAPTPPPIITVYKIDDRVIR